MTFHKYHKIKIVGDEENKDIFSNPKDEIVIEEKIDGANFRFMIKDGEIIFGSRTQELGENKEHKYEKNFRRCIKEVQKCFQEIGEDLLGASNNKIFYGECCVSGDTIIQKAGGGPLTNKITIRDMYNFKTKGKEYINCYYERKDGTKVQSKIKRCSWFKDGFPQLYSLFINEDIVKYNKMTDVIYSGKKNMFELITRKGYKIKTTKEHRFWTPTGWKKLEDLKINDCVSIVRFDINISKKRNYGKYFKENKALFEKLKKERNCEVCGIDKCLEIHHKDNNPHNNKINNLKVLCTECHKKTPRNQMVKQKEYEFDKIISIEPKGLEDCYDISMAGDENERSFIGNNFILHNCVKHTMNYNWEEIPPFLGFDIYDIPSSKFMNLKNRKKLFDSWNLSMVPLIKVCGVSDIDKIDDSMVPESKYASPSAEDKLAEGIVFKNYDKQIMAKYVREKFKEANRTLFGGSKKHAKTDDEYFVAVYCTNARIDKCIFKLIDEGSKLGMEMMGSVLNMVYKDIWEEHWNEIAFSKKRIDLLKLKRLVSKRCLEVLKQMIVNNSLN